MRPRKVCPEKEALHFIASGKDKDIFQRKLISKVKGYGIIATKNIDPGEFLLEYVGSHITGVEGEALFKEYSDVDAAFLYFYSFRGQTFCVDGSKDTTKLGRFINDANIKPNSKMKIILDEQKRPHLCAFAVTEIPAGEEIVYYRGPNHQWQLTTEEQLSFSLEMSDEDQELKDEEMTEKEVIHGNLPCKTQQTSHKSNPQRHNTTVKMSSNTAHQRVYDKKNYCLYCEKPYAKITRHLKQKHSDKPDVAEALRHKEGSTRHGLLFTKIRNMGNYHHNCSVLSSGKGQIIPKRQATFPAAATDYLPCKFCFAMYVKTDLWRHHKRCRLQVKKDRPVKSRVQTSCSPKLPTDTPISTGLKAVLQEMGYDNITELVQADALIIALGEKMLLQNEEDADIRNQMRTLARLVLMARTIDKDVVFLKDLICPRKFNTVLKAVKQMTGFNALSNRFSEPLTALQLRHSLESVSHILQVEALLQDDDVLKSKAKRFIKLIQLEWAIHISSNALKTIYRRKRNSPKKLLLSEDTEKLPNSQKDVPQNINCEESSDVQCEGIFTSQNETSQDEQCEKSTTTSGNSSLGIKKSSLPSNPKGKPRRPWSETEREVTEHYFQHFLKEMMIPGKVDCQTCLDENQILRDNGRDWKAVKYFVYNKITAMKRPF